ncbi:RNA polymerase sigma factor, partial [Fulvivirga sp. RKSG066]|uniref:RNA polymerase sigma factor n=1 Tax=Fulvivirga aurantia TaxID=2529383 RepID=UPI0012BCED8C
MAEKHKNIHHTLINRCREGDRYAQRRLYDLYAKAMYNICFRITNNQEDAEDVLQDAFVSAFRNINGYKGEATFGAWLKRIVINKALNAIKKSQLEFVPIDEPEHYVDESPAELDFGVSIDQVKMAINQLPDGYRVVFSLYL